MNKLKASILLLLSFLILLAGTRFPWIVSAIEDNRTLGQLSFSDIRPVQLELQRDIPSLGKLALLNRMDSSLTIPVKKASMTREQALDAARTQLQPYIEAGLISGIEEKNIEIEPCLIQASGTPELSGIIWMIHYSDNGLYGLVQIAIDDETGKLLLMDCIPEREQDVADYQQLMDTFAHLYFTGLEIDDYIYFITPELDNTNVGDSAIGRRYRFGDTQYGEVCVDLIVYQNGFYTQFHP